MGEKACSTQKHPTGKTAEIQGVIEVNSQSRVRNLWRSVGVFIHVSVATTWAI